MDLSPADRWTFPRTPSAISNPKLGSPDTRSRKTREIPMVNYIKSDLDFILEQIKIAEAHAAGQPLYGADGLVPAYNLSLGLRTVDGTYNHLLPGQENGARPTASSRPCWIRFTGRQMARRSIPTVPGRRRQCRQRSTTIPRTIPTRWSSTRACARFPISLSTRRWVIRPRS